MSLQESDKHMKEEPEWEDYCISEAQAREAASGRGVKLEPGLEPPSSITAAPETECKTCDSINSDSNARKSTDTEKNNNDSVKEENVKEENVKEESEEDSWLQQLTGLYKDTDNNDEPKLGLNPLSGTSENVEINRKSEEPNAVPQVFQKTKVVNTRKDMVLINNIAQEVNEKNISRPVIIKYLGRKQPAMPAKTNPVLNKPDVCKKVVINPKIGLLSQPSMTANPLLINDLISISDSVKKQSSTSVPQGYNQTVPLLNSVAYNNSAIPKQSPRPCPIRRATKTTKQPLPTSSFQSVNGPMSRPLPEGIAWPITLPITQMKGNVPVLSLLKNLPSKTTTGMQNFQTGTISKLKPGTATKFQPGNIYKLQPGIEPKLQSNTVLASKTNTLNSQAGPPTLQPVTVPSFQVKFVPTLKPGNPASLKSVTEVTQPFNKPIIGNRFDSDKSNYQKVAGNDKSLVSDNTSTSGSLKTIITATPTSKATPQVPANHARIAPKPIPKVIYSQTPKAVERNVIFKNINGYSQSVTQYDAQVARQIDNDVFLLNNDQRLLTQKSNVQPMAPKTVPKVPGPLNSQISKLIDNYIIRQSINEDRRVLTQNCNVQPMAPKTVPKVPGPLNSQISKSIDNYIIRQSINDDRRVLTQNCNVQPMAPKTVPKVPGPLNSQISKSIDNYIIRQSINEDRRVLTQNCNVQPMAPKTVPKVPGPLNSQISKSIDNYIIRQSINEDRRVLTQNCNVQPMAPKTVPKVPGPLNSQISKSIYNYIIRQNINEDRRVLTQNCNVQPMAPKTVPKVPGPLNSQISKSIGNYIIRQSINEDRRVLTQNCNVAPKTIPKVRGALNSQISKSIDNGITPQVRNYGRQVVTQNLPPNSKDSEPSEKVVNLKDFLKPSCVVLERLKEKTCKGCKNTSYECKDPAREKPVLNLGNEGAIRKYDDRDTTTRLTCKYCQRGFYKYHLLFLHVQRDHLGMKRREYHCDYCGKICTDKHNLICHIRTHTGEKPFKCSICKTHYRTESNLVSHNLNIHGRRKHICPICKRPLTWSTNMTRHMSTHFGKHSVDRPHVCLICEKRFIQKHHLTRHLESHSGVRRYICDICKMRFTRKNHLQRHIENIHMKRLKRRVRRVKSKKVKLRD